MTQYDDDDDVSGELSGQSLNPADFADGRSHTFRITRVDKKTFDARNGRAAEERRVLTFSNGRILSLNRTNLKLMAKWFGVRPSAWVGQYVTVYRDESVSFAGQLTGGWRLRKPSKQDLAPTQPDADAGSDVPF